MKKLLIFFLTTTLLLTLYGCGTSKTNSNSTIQKPTSTAAVQKQASVADNSLEDLKSIEVTNKLQDVLDGKQKLVVYVKNKTQKIFSGSLAVLAKGPSNETVGNDVMIVEKLMPGETTNSILWINPSSNIELKTNWLSPKFEDNPNNDTVEFKIDEDATKQLNQDMFDGFGGAGNPQYKTSWYDNINTINVYSNGTDKWTLVKVNENDEKKVNSILNTIFTNNSYLKKVEIHDINDKYITERDR